jgi:putative toxin-antitoxin system antitoxin component (TIGR02293 family)
MGSRERPHPDIESNAPALERGQWRAYYLGLEDSEVSAKPHKIESPDLVSRDSMRSVVEAGLTVYTAESLRRRTHMTVKRFGRFIPRSTLQSKRERDQKLSIEQSDRLMRLADVYAHAAVVFGDSERAERWMKRTNPQMPDERTPEEMLETSYGAQLVDDVLTQLEHGVLA